MKFSIYFIFFTFICSFYAQISDDVYFEDGCYFIQNEKFGCLKATVFACDNEWFFQMTTPISEQGGTFIMADGIIPFSQDFYECYTMETGCDFCLAFYDSYFDGEMLITQSRITTQCRNHEPIEYDLGEFTAQGPECGEVGYYDLPCPTNTMRYFYSPMSASTLNNIMTDTNDFYDVFYQDGNCLWVNTNDEIGPVVCPTILLDRCGDEAIFTSSAGLTFKYVVNNEQSDKLCTQFTGTLDFCVQLVDINYEGNIVYGDTVITVEERTTGIQVYYYIMGMDDLTFPDCGASHLECWDDYYYYFPSHGVYFTTDVLSFIFSYVLDTSFSSNHLWNWSSVDSSDWVWTWTTNVWDSPSSSSSSTTRHWTWESPSEHSPHSRSHSHSSSSHNATGAIFALLSVFCLLAAVVVIIIVIILIKRRQNQQSNPDAVYSLMVE